MNCERVGSAFVVRRSWKLLHLSALDCWILKEVSKALAREKPHLASSQQQPAASAPGRAVSPAVAQEFCHSAAGGCREQQLGCQLSATHLRQPQKFVVSISKRLKPSHLGMKSRNSTVFLVWGLLFVCFFPHFTKVPVCNELEII